MATDFGHRQSPDDAGRPGTAVFLGLAAVTGAAPESIDSLLQDSDRLLYEVKRGGRDGTRLESASERGPSRPPESLCKARPAAPASRSFPSPLRGS